MLQLLKKDLEKYCSPEKVTKLQSFFKTGKGEYAEGDKFIGVTVPDQRKISRKYYKEVSTKDAIILLKSGIHEHRLTALFILILQFDKGDQFKKKEIYDAYLNNTKHINNWDLVDSSAPNIVGCYLMDKDRSQLYKLARSKDLWEKRIAMLSTFYFIKQKDFDDALKIAEILVNDEHDLIHKAVGWMLREIGNRDLPVEESFLNKYYKSMPRTMLRYSIEKFNKAKKRYYMM